MNSIKDHLVDVEKQRQIYYRGTNNRDEESWIRQGTIQRSTNHLTGQQEAGLSVSDVSTVGRYFKHLYALSGREVGTGADGEPLLDIRTVKFIKWIK
jgi:hypothetical protein